MSTVSASLSPLVSSSGTRSFSAGESAVFMVPTLVRYRGQSHVQGSLTFRRNPAMTSRIWSRRETGLIRCSSALSPELKTTLDKFVTSEKVILFMKGTKDFPQCGFSNTCVQILKSLNVHFETVNILDNEILRQGLKEYSQWPTFPQLYIDGEFFGGCDITLGRIPIVFTEAYKSGELQELLEKAQCS